MPTKGEDVTLPLVCSQCNNHMYPLPLKDFASGSAACGASPPHKYAIPNNGRYRRLIGELDSNQPAPGELRGLVSARAEPYLVRYYPDSGEVVLYHVDTHETREIGRGRHSGSSLNFQQAVPGDALAAVMQWLQFEVPRLTGN